MQLKSYALLATMLLGLAETRAQSLIGITTDDRLFQMQDPAQPGTISTPVAVTGLQSGQHIAGADFRPNTGELYLLGYDNSNGNAQLYTLNTTTAVATAVGAAIVLDLGSGSVGFDFNPTVDRIRVTAANRKNYRLHPVTGAIAATDGDLAFAAGDVNAGFSPAIGASAYTNSYIGSEATTLYNYDEQLNIITTQAPPNNGTQNTVGSSGILVNPLDRTIDMDIYFDAAAGVNRAYLCANTLLGSNDGLYTLDLATGTATLTGTIGSGIQVKNIAVTIDRTLPALSGKLVYALTRNNNNLISFDSDMPSLIRSLVPVSGITAGQVIAGMDFRPANRQLYALGYDPATLSYQLYTLDVNTGAATAVNSTPGTIDLGTGNVGFDFNPVPDRIRVVSAANGTNYRLHPDNGTIAATDSALAFIAGDVHEGATPRIGTVAYTNSYAGATATTLLGIDDSLGIFTTINPPNDGKVNTLTGMLPGFNTADLSLDIDFYYDSVAMANTGFLAANTGARLNDELYTLAADGTATLAGAIGFGVPVKDIAVRIDFTNTQAPTGIAGIGNLPGVPVIWPNPADDRLSFSLPQPATGLLARIMDVTGKLISELKPTNGNIDLQGLAGGMYLLQLYSEKGYYQSVKFIKK